MRLALRRWWTAVTAIELDAPLGEAAGELAERHALRGTDAIHLATAAAVRDSGRDRIVFGSWDRELRDAAKRERLATVPA